MPVPFLFLMVYFAHPTLTSLSCGFAVVALGEFTRLWGVSIAGSETRTTGPVGGTFLITTGPFAHVRNPLYVGNMLIYFGVGIMSMALFPWLAVGALLIFFLQYTLIVSLEEEHLREKFGDEFARYVASVPRFIPKPGRYQSGSNEQPALDWRRGLRSERRTLQAIVLTTLILILLRFVRN